MIEVKRIIIVFIFVGIVAISVVLTKCTKDDDINSAGIVVGSFTDSRDNKIYKTVKIGEQYWMSENMNYSAGGWIYNNNSANAKTYGRLYDWITACDVCPDGWHLPSDDEWSELVNFLGGDSVAGGKLKEVDTTHWTFPNAGATNASGFSALPGGTRYDGGNFYGLGSDAYFWTSSKYTRTTAWRRSLSADYDKIYKSNLFEHTYSFSVRCLKN